MTTGSKRRELWVATLAACLMAACGGSSSPASPTSPTPTPPTTSTPPPTPGPVAGGSATCRNIATAYTSVITTNTGFSANTTGSCTFNSATFSGTCNTTYTDSTGVASRLTINAATVYTSLADIVDEVSVIPPRALWVSASATQTNSAGVITTGSSTNTYDAQRRVVRTTGVSAAVPPVTTVTTYTTWDASGRPTTAREVGPNFDNTRIITYDDAQRTRTNTVNGTPVVTVETFDADGNILRQVATGGSAVSTTVFTTTATASVCK